MPTVKLFVKSGCSRCPQAKQACAALREEGFNVTEYDVETADGLAEGAFYSVQATPSIIIVDKKDKVIGDFRGEVPPLQALRDALTGS